MRLLHISEGPCRVQSVSETSKVSGARSGLSLALHLLFLWLTQGLVPKWSLWQFFSITCFCLKAPSGVTKCLSHYAIFVLYFVKTL